MSKGYFFCYSRNRIPSHILAQPLKQLDPAESCPIAAHSSAAVRGGTMEESAVHSGLFTEHIRLEPELLTQPLWALAHVRRHPGTERSVTTAAGQNESSGTSAPVLIPGWTKTWHIWAALDQRAAHILGCWESSRNDMVFGTENTPKPSVREYHFPSSSGHRTGAALSAVLGQESERPSQLTGCVRGGC